MWNDRKSIQLSLALVDLFGLIALVCACTMPMIAGWYAEQFGRSAQMRRVLTIAFYCCLPFAIAALGALHHLLHNLLKERPFIAQNVTLLRQQSADVVFNSYQGLRVPKDAVRVEDGGQTGVYVLEGATARWKPITILHDNGESYVVELDKTSTANLWPGDEVIIHAKNLYDGKVVGK